VHLVADEVMTGCGRTGTFFAHERAGIRPDFMCLSKGITGGYLPLSLVMTTDDVYAAFYDDSSARGFLHSHSYTGNALACRAALATLEIFERGDVLVGNAAKAQYLTQAAQEIAQHPRVKNFRTTGMIWAFDVDTDDAMFGRRFYEAALEHQVILRPIGNTIYFMPPYVIEEGQMDFLVMQTKHALEQALSAS
jgi:adenosylmethionine-8-amino-7-oxononanoate aminotransferase